MLIFRVFRRFLSPLIKISCIFGYNLKPKDMKTLSNMNQEEKNNHLSRILSKINNNKKYIIEDVTPDGYGPEEN